MNKLLSSTLFILMLSTVCTAQQQRVTVQLNQRFQYQFEQDENGWSASRSILYRDTLANLNPVRTVDLIPTGTEWEEFDFMISHLSIFDLPDQADIENRKRPIQPGGNFIRFQVYDGNTTRTFSYENPVSELADYWQVKNVFTFITYVLQDFEAAFEGM
ncbi:MAG: hypothetical protein AAFW89_00760 [Bacteroidota bacterium]